MIIFHSRFKVYQRQPIAMVKKPAYSDVIKAGIVHENVLLRPTMLGLCNTSLKKKVCYSHLKLVSLLSLLRTLAKVTAKDNSS